jgi:hypothetical protein
MTSQSQMFFFRVYFHTRGIVTEDILSQSSGRIGHFFRQVGPIINAYITFSATV